uniref:Uncharacterized protein n=1 Tax=Lactuca sativa TaxID=4236 RepID=A0A9R1X2B4_LACSA|nr:hypothetical protein LSAT_V11C700363250 [Lactuca sativa]
MEREDEENYIWALHEFKEVIRQGNRTFVIMSEWKRALMSGLFFPTIVDHLCVCILKRIILSVSMSLIFLCLVRIMLYIWEKINL